MSRIRFESLVLTPLFCAASRHSRRRRNGSNSFGQWPTRQPMLLNGSHATMARNYLLTTQISKRGATKYGPLRHHRSSSTIWVSSYKKDKL